MNPLLRQMTLGFAQMHSLKTMKDYDNANFSSD